LKDRKEQHLGRVQGEPSSEQIQMARSMAQLEWSALVAERTDDLRALREAREHRRLLLRTIADFELTLDPQPVPRRKRSGKLSDHLGGR
jgi:hypothetical protein